MIHPILPTSTLSPLTSLSRRLLLFTRDDGRHRLAQATLRPFIRGAHINLVLSASDQTRDLEHRRIRATREHRLRIQNRPLREKLTVLTPRWRKVVYYVCARRQVERCATSPDWY